MPISSQLPPLLVTAARASALDALVLRVGQVLDGKVLGLASGGGTQVEIGGRKLALVLPAVIAPGTEIQLEVQQASAGKVRLVLRPSTEAVAIAPTETPQSPLFVSRPASSPLQAALQQMMQDAVPRQGSVANLTAALAALPTQSTLPELVLRVARQILDQQMRLDSAKVDGSALQKAFAASGLFQEANLGAGTAPAQLDLKASLLALRKTLAAWLGQEQTTPTPAASKLAPPLRGLAPRALPAEPAPIDLETSTPDFGRKLLEHTDAALSRLRLHQAASLPDPAAPARADWSVDLPVVVGLQQTVLHIQIHREPPPASAAETERSWQMRFALHLTDLGEVGAQVSLRGTNTGVLLWASEPATAEALAERVEELNADLAASGLRPGAVLVRHGAPAPSSPAATGHIVDERR